MEPIEVFNGLAIFVDGHAARRINVWRKRFDPTYGAVDPHITLAYPPFVPLEKWEEIRPLVVSCLSDIAPFKIVFRETGTFVSKHDVEPNVLWLKPDDGGVIVRLRKILEFQFPEFVPQMEIGYIPHLSIGFIQGEGPLKRALLEVQKTLGPIEFTAREIVYEALDPVGGVQFFDPIPLELP